MTDPSGVPWLTDCDLPVLVCADPRGHLGDVSSWIYGYPAGRLQIVGVTGTNGKTTVTRLMEAAISSCGASVGVIGTTGIKGGGLSVASPRTTPEATDLHAVLAVMAERGVETVVMEVSSHALVLDRVGGIRFAVAVFTNLTQDHLDFHGDLEDYFAAKSRLFQPGTADLAVINVDCPWGRRLRSRIEIASQGYSVESAEGAEWVARDIVRQGIGYRYRLTGPGVDERGSVGLPGDFNLSNAVAATAAAINCGYDARGVQVGIAKAEGPPGRMERVPVSTGAVVLVDYAHTPDAVALAARVGRGLVDPEAGRLTVVLGAGGDRDRDKRESMGLAAGLVADRVIVTDDNPRTESPAAIRERVLAGARDHRAEVLEVGDRGEAVACALADAGTGDVVMVLGKGHESGQEIEGMVYPMDDRELIRSADLGSST